MLCTWREESWHCSMPRPLPCSASRWKCAALWWTSPPGTGISWLCSGSTFSLCCNSRDSRRGDANDGRCGGATRHDGCIRAVTVWHLLEKNRDVAVPAFRFPHLWRAAVRLQLWAYLESELAHAVRQGQHHQCHDHDGLPALELPHHGARRPGVQAP